jgi:hypothetical protein
VKKIRGEAIPRDAANIHKNPGFDKPEYYKNVLKCFKRNEDIGKKDLIILQFFSEVHPIYLFQDGSYSFHISLLAVWFHERYGHLQLYRKLGMMKWYGLMTSMLWRIFSVKMSMEEYRERKGIIEKVIKKIEHFIIKSVILKKYERSDLKIRKYYDELRVYDELYSYLAELIILFYKVYKGDLQRREMLEEIARMFNHYPTGIHYNALEYLRKNKKLASFINKLRENSNTLTNKDFENMIISIAMERKKIEKRLKELFENKVYKELRKIEKELKA